ncbi:unnamed protein product [Porites evermanni]|uniref:Uncharacterized protein n=1 Tax=Porites evermanni TaxID=104178 RepID=A0ABN8T162_9CNID|nr:unnamed protein product [Porites evermanni]
MAAQGKRKALVLSQNEEQATTSSTTSKKSKKCPKNKVWTSEQVELVLRYIKDYKTKCDFNGIDFEADLASMYTEIRRCMAVDFPDDFGPEVVTEPTKSLKEMSEEQYEAFKRQRDTERSQTKKGYDRVKEKIRNVRQDFHTAVNKGTRSGSGKIVQENFELLSEIWGGSPTTTSLSFGIDADLLGRDKSLEMDLVDNKRRHMEKTLSQAQRDQLLMNTAKEDLLMKREMVKSFEQ